MDQQATFDQLFRTFYVAANLFPNLSDEAVTDAQGRLADDYSAMQEASGLVGEQWCEQFPAAAWYGDRPLRIYSSFNAHAAIPIELRQLVERIGNLEDEARSLLEGDTSSLRRCLDVVFSAITHIYYAADEFTRGGPPALLASVLGDSQRALAEAERVFAALTQRRAQLDYFVGMVAGAAALIVFAGVLAIAAPVFPRADDYAVDNIAGCILGGALGAVFSVLSRMHSGRLELAADAGRRMLQILGVVRPVVGAVAGVALFLIIDGEALDVFSQPDSSARAWSFYAGLAFVAGFSERWFQDMLAVDGGEGSTAPTSGKGASTPPSGSPPEVVPVPTSPTNPRAMTVQAATPEDGPAPQNADSDLTPG